MKTLTLDEAFAKAIKGPLQIGGEAPIENTRDDYKKILSINAPNPTGGGQDIAYAHEDSAALLAHCFNHMRELWDALQSSVTVMNAHAIGHKTQEHCEKILTKANTVTLPE